MDVEPLIILRKIGPTATNAKGIMACATIVGSLGTFTFVVFKSLYATVCFIIVKVGGEVFCRCTWSGSWAGALVCLILKCRIGLGHPP